MIKLTDVYNIGKIGKPHGVQGEISFHFTDDIFDVEQANYVFLLIDGILIPFFIETYRFKTNETALVQFEGINTQERAKALTGVAVYYPRPLNHDQDSTISYAQIVGFAVKNAQNNKIIGHIEHVDTTTTNTLFHLDNGILLPAHNDFIVDIDVKNSELTMQLPAGLLNN